MKAKLLSLLMLLALWGSSSASPETYKGWVFLDEKEHPAVEVIVIESAKQFNAWQKRLPDKVPSKKRPGPANPDPLRKPNAIDFSKHRLLVLERAQTLSGYPAFVELKESDDEILAVFKLPELVPEARPFGWGAYRAVLIPRVGKSIQVKYLD